ncbi:MAG: non-canonical purine NTP pyrophosphatase [Patescibacteria group bacterium]
MNKLLLATHNKGKIRRYRNLFSDIGINLISLDDLNIKEKIEEPFKTSKENSIHKAIEYSKISKIETIAVDEFVITNFLPDNYQPGVFVRRFNKEKRELRDTEVLDVWKKIFLDYKNNNLKFSWDFSLSYYNPKNKKLKTASAVQIDLVSNEFSKIINPGYPMSSFLIPEGYKKTYSELSPKELLTIDKKNLKPFTNLIKSLRG